MVAEDVEVAVVGENFEALIAHAVPLVEDFRDLIGANGGRRLPANVRCANQPKAQRALISFVARVAFDLESQAHYSILTSRGLL